MWERFAEERISLSILASVPSPFFIVPQFSPSYPTSLSRSLPFPSPPPSLHPSIFASLYPSAPLSLRPSLPPPSSKRSNISTHNLSLLHLSLSHSKTHRQQSVHSLIDRLAQKVTQGHGQEALHEGEDVNVQHHVVLDRREFEQLEERELVLLS